MTNPVHRGFKTAILPEQLQQIITSQTIFRAKSPKRGRHVWPRSQSATTERKTAGFPTKTFYFSFFFWGGSIGTRSYLMTREIRAENFIYFNAEIRFKLACVPPDNRVPRRGGQTESLWDCNYGRRSLELRAEPSVDTEE